MPQTLVIVGNPKPQSRTMEAALLLHDAVFGAAPSRAVDLADLGSALLGYGNPAVMDVVEAAQASDGLVIASPTYKASYTGLLKLFLDQVPGGGLDGIFTIAMMMGAGPAHALAPEVHLKPVLAELGCATCTRALYLNEKTFREDGLIHAFAARARMSMPASLSPEIPQP